MNFRLLLSIAFITALAACGGAEERKAVYMEKAKSSMETGDLDKARIELKNVLQIDPKDGEAYYQLGKVYEQQKEYRKAYGNYLKAEELSPELLANHAKLGRFYLLLMNDADKTKEKIDLILSKEPENSDGLLLKAALTLREGKIDEATSITESIIARNPEHVESVAFLASLYLKDKRVADAIEVLDTALKTNESNEQLNKLLAAILVTNKDYERAEVIYKSFLERNPDTAASYNNLAAFYNQIDSKDKAEDILRASIENDPKDVQRQLSLIKYIRDIKGNEAAITETKKLIADDSSLGKLRTALAELYILNDDRDAATNTYLDAIKDFPEDFTGVDSRVSLAGIYINDQNISRAKEVIEEAVNISPNNPKVNFLRAKLALNEKDTETATISLRIVIKEEPEKIEAYLLLANIYRYENNEEQYKAMLNTAFENNKSNLESLLKLVQFVLSSDINLAEKVVDQYNVLKENDYRGLSIKALILNKNKEYKEAYVVSTRLMELFPEQPNGYLQAIAYYSSVANTEKAISTLEKGYINTNNRKILELLTNLQVSEKEFDVVENRIKAELNAMPDDEGLKILLSKVYLTNNKFDAAENLLKDVVDNDSVSEEAYLLLARIYQSKNEFDSAEKILIKGKKNLPASINIPLGMATQYEFNQNYSEAIDIYRELNMSHPENLIITNNLASLLSDYGNGESDLELAKTLADKLLDNKQPIFLDTIGWVNYKLGDYQKAVTYLTQAVENNPETKVFNFHLGMSYKMLGNKAKAKAYLEKSLIDNKPFKEKEQAEAALKDL